MLSPREPPACPVGLRCEGRNDNTSSESWVCNAPVIRLPGQLLERHLQRFMKRRAAVLLDRLVRDQQARTSRLGDGRRAWKLFYFT